MARRHVLLLSVALLVLSAAGCSGCRRQAAPDRTTGAGGRSGGEVQKRTRPAPVPRLRGDRGPQVRTPAGRPATTGGGKRLSADDLVRRYANLTDAADRIDMLQELAAESDPATVRLAAQAMQDTDPEVRRAALEALADLDSPEVATVAMRGLSDSETDLRVAAVQALQSVTDASLTDPLLRALADPEEDVWREVFQVLWDKDFELQQPVVQAAMASAQTDIRGEALQLLRKAGNHEAMDMLIEAMRDASAEFREEIADAVFYLVSHEVTDYESARAWWESNRNRFDAELYEQDPGDGADGGN